MMIYLQMLETTEQKVRFEDLYYTYKNLMFYVANQILRNEHDAEDAVQQAFFAIAKNFEKISEIKCPQTRSFIVTIVERKAIDIYRAKNRGGVVAFDEEFINVPHTAEADSIAARADLANAMMIFMALLLIVSIVVFIKSKGRSGLRVCCVLVGLFCVVYLCGVLILAYLFGSNHGPAVPTPQMVLTGF